MGFLGMASIATGLIGAGISAYSSYQQGQAQKAMAYRNASIADAAAENEAQAAAENSKRQREAGHAKLATIRARMAGNGVNQSAGSALDTIGAAAVTLELQTMDLFRESTAKQVQYSNSAATSRWEGDQAAEAGKWSAIGSLIGGVSNAAQQGYDFQQSGVIRSS